MHIERVNIVFDLAFVPKDQHLAKCVCALTSASNGAVHAMEFLHSDASGWARRVHLVGATTRRHQTDSKVRHYAKYSAVAIGIPH